MPEFQLDCGVTGGLEWFQSLDSFTQGYVEAMFFTECHADSPELEDATVSDLSEAARAALVEACREFQVSFAEDLTEAYDAGRINGYDETRAGADFWYTRNDHGVGFWDRDLGDIGEHLSDMSGPYGSHDLYRGDDGLLYVS